MKIKTFCNTCESMSSGTGYFINNKLAINYKCKKCRITQHIQSKVEVYYMTIRIIQFKIEI